MFSRSEIKKMRRRIRTEPGPSLLAPEKVLAIPAARSLSLFCSDRLVERSAEFLSARICRGNT
jgi:hypothetical protein